MAALEIEGMIMEGELPPSARVNENALATMLNVSRALVLEACRKLEQARLLEVIVNRGAFVRQLTFDEALELHQMRKAPHFDRLALLTKRIEADQIAGLDDLVARMQRATKKGDAPAYYPLNLEFHSRTLSVSGWKRTTELCLGVERELRLFCARYAASTEDLLNATSDHRGIVDALGSGSAERAAAGTAYWMRVRERWMEKATAAASAPSD